jgi:hypothetical protein
VTSLDRVHVTRCDAAHWARLGCDRPAKHQERQRRNLCHVYQSTDMDWVLHIDVDEFLLADRPVSALLSAVPREVPTVKAAPFEGLSGRRTDADIYASRQFRGVVADAALRQALFGRFAAALEHGILSHRAGKSFFRAKVAGLVPGVHFAKIGDSTTEAQQFHADLTLLHFHADDRDHWVANAHRRARHGAYRFKAPLRKLLLGLDPAGLAEFHAAVHKTDDAQLALLREAGLLIEADLHLGDKVRQLKIGKRGQTPVQRLSGLFAPFRPQAPRRVSNQRSPAD